MNNGSSLAALRLWGKRVGIALAVGAAVAFLVSAFWGEKSAVQAIVLGGVGLAGCLLLGLTTRWGRNP